MRRVLLVGIVIAMFQQWSGTNVIFNYAQEIFPNHVRGAAMAVCTAALWIASFLLTYTFPFLNAGLGTGGTFLLYAFICLSGFIFTLRRIPETKGKSLEELENELTR